MVKFRHIDLRNCQLAGPVRPPHDLLPERLDLLRRGGADAPARAAGPAPPPRRLAGDGQRRDPARGAGVVAQAFAVAVPEGGMNPP